MRNINAPTYIDSTGKRRIATWIFIAPVANSNDIYIRITSPDRLDKLASRFYQDQYKWPVIAAANGIGKGTMWVKSNSILRIPNINDINITDFVTTINNTR